MTDHLFIKEPKEVIMVFITACLWGTGISLGMCVGLVTWALIRPAVTGEKDQVTLFREYNRISSQLLRARNELTEDTNAYLKRIAIAAENNAVVRTIAAKMPKNADRETILLGDTVWIEVPEGAITQGFVESIEQGRVGDCCHGEYTIGWDTAARKGLKSCGNLDCNSTRETAQAAKEKKGTKWTG